ncbi:helix-turn-helix transcriptional regulator [Shewanella sp. Scap07]|uniref:helix-turn-helix transcriptional regulator n=1 Tax=Shewanella sp. Scap07 TaxID=2589987 RepID=UPI0015BA1815|nr:helix-turn-helix transcriptional regulator [Shewanella sp. Scap07]QLE84186.1 helix-turn-helix transcriptional regulator [Shewanella sp. Scap07]
MLNTPDIVKSLRLTQGYSVSELAQKMGCSRQTIYNWEDGISEPKLSQFIKLCVVVGLNPNNLLPRKAIGQHISDKEVQDEHHQSAATDSK